MMSEEEIERLPSLGISYAEFVRVERLPREEAEGELGAIKDRAHKAYRQLVKKLHPDINGGDAAKTQEFVHVTNLVKKIERLELGVREVVYDEPDEEFYSVYDSRVYGVDYASESSERHVLIRMTVDPFTGSVLVEFIEL